MTNLTWLADDVISLREKSKDRFRRFKVIKLDIDDDDITQDNIKYLNKSGYWLNPLIKSSKFALFAMYKSNDDYNYHVDLFRLNLRNANLDGQTKNKKRLNRKGAKAQQWITDSKGHRTAGIRTKNSITELFVRTGKKPKKYRWPLAWTSQEDDYLNPVLYDQDNAVLYVITNANTDKKSLQQFDLNTHKFTKVVYSHPKYDISSALLSSDGSKIIGVSFMDSGLYTRHYFTEELQNYHSRISETSGSDNTYLIDNAVENDNQLFNISDSNNSGEIFVYKNSANQFQSIVKLRPWLERANLQKSELVSLKTKDGSDLEAFLTLPQNATTEVPLVVIPHGGPIGVSDSRHYSADIQVLVNAGYATLQVNFRGSEGYGKNFKQNGMKQWGQLIEDDIEQALSHIKDNYPVNPEKVCIIGASYGGYSALFSVIRSPQLYQCAASFAGVTDLALRFQRSDYEKDDNIKQQLRKIVGDPEKEQEMLFSHSPVYRASEINTPLFIAHGTDDKTVDIEHAYRLKFALKANKIPFEWVVLDGFGHGFETVNQAEFYYAQLIAFLDTHLK
jgi:dipeptidyl aminopeptidase/acylaminoacyl peptidase